MGLENGSGSGEDTPAMPRQPGAACTPRPASTRGDMSLPVPSAWLRQGPVHPSERTVWLSCPLGWRDVFWVLAAVGWNEGGIQGGLL